MQKEDCIAFYSTPQICFACSIVLGRHCAQSIPSYRHCRRCCCCSCCCCRVRFPSPLPSPSFPSLSWGLTQVVLSRGGRAACELARRTALQDTHAQLSMRLLFLSLALPCLGRPPLPLAPSPLLFSCANLTV